jgi:hypothetical protein
MCCATKEFYTIWSYGSWEGNLSVIVPFKESHNYTMFTMHHKQSVFLYNKISKVFPKLETYMHI